MPKYKLEDGQIVDTTNYSETSLEYFILENPDATVIEDFQEDSANVVNPSTESKNTGLNVVDGSLELVDPFSNYYVTPEDLRNSEEIVSPALNKKLSGVGISTSEGTSIGGLNALNLKSSKDVDIQGPGIISRSFSEFTSAIGIGKDRTDEELVEAAAEINAYIKEKGDIDYISKAKERSGDAYEKYTEYITAPDVAYKDLKASMKEDLVSKFSRISRGERKNITRKVGGEITTVGIEETPATVDDFKSEEEYNAYKQWKKDGYIQDFSESEVVAYDEKRKRKFALDASSEYASDTNASQRIDVLALAADDEKKLTNLQEEANKFFNIQDAYENSVQEYKLNPTDDNFMVASIIELDYLREQGKIQSLQNKLKADGTIERSKSVPLALMDFNKDYNRMRQLRSSFKSLGTDIAYGVAQLSILAGSGPMQAAYLSSPALLSSVIDDTTGLASLGQDMQVESERFQRAIKVDEINSVSDAGRWVAGSTVNLIPSLSMAFAGPAAMPLFFMSGSGGKGLEIAINQKNASERMIKNKQFLIDNPDLDALESMFLEQQMEKDAKTLNLSSWQTLGVQALYGVAEVAFERLGTMSLLKNVKNGIKMLPPTTIKEGFNFVGKQLAQGIRVEGGSEFATTVAQNFGDIFILGEDKNLFEGGLESFAQGALMGGGMNSINISKGLRQGYTSVMASKAESKKLENVLQAIRKITGEPKIQGWGDVAGLKLKLPKETQDVVDSLIKDMQQIEQGVLFKLGTTLSVEQAYAVEEKNRSMRLINKQLINASNNPNISPAQLKNIEAELRVKFDALTKDREALLSDSTNAKETKNNFTNTQVSLDSSLGYAYYQQSMLTSSVASVVSNYNNLSPEANQLGLDGAKEELIKLGEADPSIDAIKDKALNTYIDNTYKEKINQGRANAETFAEQQGLDLEVMSFEGKDSNAETIAAFEDAGITGSELAKLKKAVRNGSFEGGQIPGTNKVIVNMDAAVKNRRIGIFAHEILHAYAREKYKGNQKAIDLAGADLLAYLEKNDADLFARVQFRIDQSYTEKDAEGNVIKDADYFEEAMNAMSDVLADGQSVNESAMNKIRVFANSFLSGLPDKFQFKKDQGRDAYEFVKNYNKAAHFGGKGDLGNKITSNNDKPEEEIPANVKQSITKSAGALDAINNIVPKEVKTKADFQKPKVFNKAYEATIGNGVISNYVKSKATSTEMYENTMDSIRDRLMNYNPATDRKTKSGNPITFGEFIFANTNFAIADAKKKLAIEGEKRKKETSADTKEAIQIAAPETTVATIDKPKYKKIKDSNVIPKETIDNIQAKVLKTVRVLKSKIDEDVSINKTVTPLVAEIKKDMGKQADIDFKKAMGGKKDGKLRSFLIKNKKAILTNMTTTWLMQAMPGAVQKQVNGSFTSDWQGKKIDREKVTTQQAGRTSGNEIVRRLPNAVNNLSDADFLGYVLDKKGDPIRGRKESLAKAMAEEISLELFDDAISDPDSNIRKAFEDNQGALGVLIAENIAQDVSRQVERGSVKFSKTGLGSLSKAEAKKWNEGKEEFFNSIYKFNGAYKENNVLQAHIDVYGSEFTEKQHKNIAKQFFKPLDASAKGDIKITEKLASVNKTLENFLEDIANDVDGDVTIQQLTNSPESVTASYEDWNNVIESRTVVVNALKDGNIDAQTAVAFLRSTFANSGRIGRWVRNKIDKDKTHRSDLFAGKKQIINALNQAGYNIKNITRTTIEFKDGTVEKRKYSSAVTSAKKYLGNYDVKAEKENADAAWNFTTKILEGLKGKDPKIQAMIMSAMNSGTNTSLRVAAPVLGRPTVLPSKNTKDYTPEHAVPARVALLHMYEYFVKGNKDVDIDALKSDYRVIMLPKSMDKVLTGLKLRQSMIAGYIPGESNWSSRYYNFNTRGKVQYAIESLEDGSVEGQSYADYYKEKNKPIANTVPLEVIKESKIKFSKADISLSDSFNKMIERQKGVESYKEFSKAVAEIRGKKVGKYKFFISPAAEDFRGLTQYVFAGKGKQGEADQKFFEDNLMTPYFEGISKVESERQAILDDTKGLLKMFKPIKKKINKYIEDGDYTYDAAIRVYLWNKAGIDIPGLSKRDQKKLNKIVVDDVELSGFAEALLAVSRQDSWPKPSEYWLAQTTLSDLNALTEKTNRKKYLNEFIENVDVIFSETNLNKVEALYGKPTRKAIENSISAMKSGSNRANQGQGDEITSRWNNWVNSSIGTIMFFNRRSAILQTLSAANFINWSDNNPLKAGLAFANQPQYWKDFAMIFNSDKLKQRRGGLKSDVQESEIANAAKNSKDKAQAIISYMLKIGFTPTQLADSFAISLGGASLYRNRVNTYKKQGLDQKDAEYKAFADFSKLSDEAQQSGDPALVSQQQRSIAGRLVLSFQNTTMQYTRLMKKAAQDIKNNRGSYKNNVSKIIYYGAVQNFIFSALSNSLFALIPGFDEDDEDDDEKKAAEVDKKTSRILNNMTDSVLRGTGIYGAVVATLKNTIKKAIEETEKGFKGDGTKVILEAANLAPAIGSKLRKIYSAYQTYQFDKDIIKNYPLNIKMLGKFNPSPTYNIIGNLTSATLNIPLDRAISEARALSEVLDSRNTKFQRLALSLGWRTWDVNAKNEEGDLIKTIVKLKRKQKKAAERKLDRKILKQLNK